MKLLLENWQKYLKEGLTAQGDAYGYFIDVLYYFTVQPIMQGPVAPDDEAEILGTREEFKNRFLSLPDDVRNELLSKFMDDIEDIVIEINKSETVGEL
tara:strand:+ start:71 stop:364 length:294 start_codon:yes stop_codon:yes gene_type:complete